MRQIRVFHERRISGSSYARPSDLDKGVAFAAFHLLAGVDGRISTYLATAPAVLRNDGYFLAGNSAKTLRMDGDRPTPLHVKAATILGLIFDALAWAVLMAALSGARPRGRACRPLCGVTRARICNRNGLDSRQPHVLIRARYGSASCIPCRNSSRARSGFRAR